MSTAPQRVLVTGGSGFIAGHCILHLLQQGHRVRTTVRSLDREAQVRSQLGYDGDGLEFVAADLTEDAGWAEAIAGCDVVLHVASPIPHGDPDDEQSVIRPARDGTVRVLRAARDGGVRRVVLTSAFHAIGFGYGRTDHEFTEQDWTVLDGPGVDAYGRSKTLAERAAWDLIAEEGGGLELVAVNPVAVLGPVLGPSVSGANELVRRILAGALPGYPDLWLPIVDVRDVAAAHALAMTTPGAAGERFIIGSGSGLTMAQIGSVLRNALGERAKRVPKRSIPTGVLRVAALFDKTVRGILPDLGVRKRINTDKAVRILGLRTRPIEPTVVETADSMLAAGIVT